MNYSKKLNLQESLTNRLVKEGIDPYSLTEKQLDTLRAMYGDHTKVHWLSNWISFLGVAFEIGAITNILFNITSLDLSIFIVSGIGGLFGLLLVYIGFRIQHKLSLRKLIEEDKRIERDEQ